MINLQLGKEKKGKKSFLLLQQESASQIKTGLEYEPNRVMRISKGSDFVLLPREATNGKRKTRGVHGRG